MCNANDLVIGEILGKRKDRVFHTIYHASRTLDDAQENYTIIEKERLVGITWFCLRLFVILTTM